MVNEETIKLDLTGCESLSEIHERIQKAFNFPNWYGKNWSAFWDLLWSECDADKVEILGKNTLPKEFDKHLNKMIEILQRNKDEHMNYGWKPFEYEIID